MGIGMLIEKDLVGPQPLHVPSEPNSTDAKLSWYQIDHSDIVVKSITAGTALRVGW